MTNFIFSVKVERVCAHMCMCYTNTMEDPHVTLLTKEVTFVIVRLTVGFGF